MVPSRCTKPCTKFIVGCIKRGSSSFCRPERLPGTGGWSYVELDSDKGHFASGADAALWAEDLRRFMNTEPADWAPLGFKQRDKEVAA